MKKVSLFTDGACSGNPGPGGWAFILRCERTDKELERSDGVPEATNNQMELMAVIRVEHQAPHGPQLDYLLVQFSSAFWRVRH